MTASIKKCKEKNLKKDLSSTVAKKGGDWSVHLPRVVNAYNNKNHDAANGPPSQIQTQNGGDNPQHFRALQDNAAKFVHNRAITQSRMATIREAGAFRSPSGNARSFNPAYGNIRKLKADGVDSMYVTDTIGRKTLLKQAQAAP